MRIIRPYGRSVVKRGEERKIVPRTESRERAASQGTQPHSRAIPAFAEDDPHIIIAQWISALDKVIAKPRGTHKASRELHALRYKLGNACWDRWKLHSYGKLEDTGEKPRKGRWYTAFTEEKRKRI